MCYCKIKLVIQFMPEPHSNKIMCYNQPKLSFTGNRSLRVPCCWRASCVHLPGHPLGFLFTTPILRPSWEKSSIRVLGSRSIFMFHTKDFDNYEEHRRIMKDARYPEYFNFARDVIDRWVQSENVYRFNNVLIFMDLCFTWCTFILVSFNFQVPISTSIQMYKITPQSCLFY